MTWEYPGTHINVFLLRCLASLLSQRVSVVQAPYCNYLSGIRLARVAVQVDGAFAKHHWAKGTIASLRKRQ